MNNCIRIALMFFVSTFVVFEWQAILKSQYGSVFAGQRIAMCLSLGQLLLTGCFLVWRKRPPKSPRNVAMLVVTSSLASCIVMLLGAKLGHGKLPLVYALFFFVGAVSMIANANEMAYISQSGRRLEHVRPFGSLGFLAAVVLSQWSNGQLLIYAILPSVLLLVIPQKFGKTNTRMHGGDTQSLGLSFQAILAVALVLGFVAKGYDVAVPLLLRESKTNGLYWLALMIGIEIPIVFFSGRFRPRLVLIAAPIAWTIAYVLMLNPSSNLCVGGAMVFVAFNCTWQTKLYASDELRQHHDVAYRQCQLTTAVTIGGLLFTLAVDFVNPGTLADAIYFSAMTSIGVAMAFVLSIASKLQ
jgi:hypothetical protein